MLAIKESTLASIVEIVVSKEPVLVSKALSLAFADPVKVFNEAVCSLSGWSDVVPVNPDSRVDILSIILTPWNKRSEPDTFIHLTVLIPMML